MGDVSGSKGTRPFLNAPGKHRRLSLGRARGFPRPMLTCVSQDGARWWTGRNRLRETSPGGGQAGQHTSASVVTAFLKL